MRNNQINHSSDNIQHSKKHYAQFILFNVEKKNGEADSRKSGGVI
jgi:hypothetical protein